MSNYSGLYSVEEMYYLYPVTLPSVLYGGVITDFESGGILYRAHKFVDVGIDTLQVDFVSGGGSTPVDLLVVAGGGSGGQGNTTNGNGGGGAGGVLYKTGHMLSVGTYNVMVGAGGLEIGDGIAEAGNNGENSYFGDFIAIGGGGGGGRAVNPKEGGSSGGHSLYAATPMTTFLQTDVLGATGYGNIGGQSPVNYTGCGGGGAGGVGENGASASPGGNGGPGLSFDIEGETKWYAGGGGGGGNSSQRGGTGYHGGGRGFGTGDNNSYTIYPDSIDPITLGHEQPDGIPNTGGGGGAGSYYGTTSSWPTSGKGGSGIVVVRYQIGVAA